MTILFPAKNYIVFDFETTGFDPVENEVIQMSAIKINNGAIFARFNVFVNIEKDVPAKITELTGITTEMVKMGRTHEESWSLFKEFIEDWALVGHNSIAFDKRFLEENFKRHNFTLPVNGRYVDTAMMMKARKLNEQQRWFENHYLFAKRISEIRAFGVKFNLSLCCQELEIDVSAFTAHRADSDVEMTNLVYRKLLNYGKNT